jgi:uncharacterized membrane protein
MHKEWKSSVEVDAPVERVFAAVADFERHPEWDRYTRKVEMVKPGAADGTGSEWKVYEMLGLVALGNLDTKNRTTLGLAKRHMREVRPNERVAWHTHPVPNIRIGAEVSFSFAGSDDRTTVTQTVTINVPGVLEAVARLILRDLENRQHGQWQSSLQNLKALCEGVTVGENAAVTV